MIEAIRYRAIRSSSAVIGSRSAGSARGPSSGGCSAESPTRFEHAAAVRVKGSAALVSTAASIWARGSLLWRNLR